MANFNFNKVILGGRLTADPELKQTPTFSSTKDEAPKFEQLVDDDDLPF